MNLKKISAYSVRTRMRQRELSWKTLRGCPYSPMGRGCELSVCFGCLECRFMRCNCRTCVDLHQNAVAGTQYVPSLLRWSTWFATWKRQAMEEFQILISFLQVSSFIYQPCQFRETLFVLFSLLSSLKLSSCCSILAGLWKRYFYWLLLLIF